MVGYRIVTWPEIQDYMDLPGFDENSALITPNNYMGIEDCTYLMRKEWKYAKKKES